MRLVIDCFKLVKGSGKSIGIYNVARHVVENLANNNINNNKENKKDIVVLGTKYNREDFDIPGVRFLEVHYNPQNKIMCILWELLIVPRFLKKLKADKALFPRGFAPFKSLMGKGAPKSYIIVHDMIPFYYDKFHHGILNPIENFYIMWRLKASCKGCTKIITVSEASKKEIVKIAKIKEDKIKVIHSGVDGINMKAVMSVLATNKKNNKYFSAITSKLPHKNAEGIVYSYKEYFEKSENPLDLVIIGLENVNDFNLPMNVKDHITCHKFFPKDEEMQAIIAGSHAFIFLSRKEGFGFPPIEAMQMSVPVISSGESSLKEIVQDAAMVVDPDDYDEVSDAMLRIEEDDMLCQKLIMAGRKNVKRFIWSNQIKEYMKELF